MARKKLEGDKVTKAARGTIAIKKYDYLVAKYGSISATLNKVYSDDTFNDMLAAKAAQNGPTDEVQQ